MAARLDPIISQKIREIVGDLPWTAVLSELDRLKGKPERPYDPADLHVQLRMFTEKLGELNFPFDNPYTREVSTYGQELRLARNQWAHGGVFQLEQALRIHDSVIRLLRHLGDEAGAQEAQQFYRQVLQVLAQQHQPEPVFTHGFVDVDDTEQELVEPDESVFQRPEDDQSETDNFRSNARKTKLLAIAQDAVEHESPIHLERLTGRVAAAYNIKRLREDRRKRIRRVIQNANMAWQIDGLKFVWPCDVDPHTWSEFRPNDGNAGIRFEHISPVEIANAATFIKAREPELDDEGISRHVLQVFGRKRRTKQVVEHLKDVDLLAPKSQHSQVTSDHQ